MKHLLLAGHLLGFVLWLGGSFCAMSVGAALRGTDPGARTALAGLQGRLQRGVVLPGTLLTVLTGLLLTLRLYGTPESSAGFPVPLMVMQGAGLLAAGIVLGVSLPTAARLGRAEATGQHAPLAAALQKRAAIAGSLAGALGLTALIAGAWLR